VSDVLWLPSLTHEVPMVHLREATPEDVPVICEINVRGWRAAFRELFPDEFLDTMDPGDRRSAFAELVADRSDHRSAVVVDTGMWSGSSSWAHPKPKSWIRPEHASYGASTSNRTG
jgi:hypothetical protein